MLINKYLRQSIGKKQIMALTGFLWVGFLISHLSGNFLLFKGAESFNLYAHKLVELGPILYVMEFFLLIILVTHITLAIQLTIRNRKARGPVAYKVKKNKGSFGFLSSSMTLSGTTILLFLITHIYTLKFGDHHIILINGKEVVDLYTHTLTKFSNPIYSGFYLICLVLIGMHVAHAIQSCFQSFGLKKNYLDIVKKISVVIGVLLTIGFSACVIFGYIKGGALV